LLSYAFIIKIIIKDDMRDSLFNKYETVIGLEVHAQLLTESKAFAPVSTTYGRSPNTQITPLCIGHPGTLPVLNENMVRYTIKMGLATNCSIARESIFARKNYFYPDLPKGYQISQYETPICHNGYIEIEAENGLKKIGITRIHMEEDAGKSIHDRDPYHTLVDFNRSGVPLIEIVSEPDIRSPHQAYNYLKRIRQIVRYLEICDGNMEEGSLRCDANISVRPRRQVEFGTRTELKNMNSFRNVERALEFEVERQIDLIEEGEAVIQQTLLWDANAMETRMMRTKEEAHDYRYFPEPDLPTVIVDDKMLDEIQAGLPELPDARKKRFIEELGMSQDDAINITENRYLADYYEEILACDSDAKAASNIMLTDVLRVLNEKSIDIRQFSVTPERLSELIALRENDKINSSAMTEIFDVMVESNDGKSAEEYAKELNLIQVSDTSFIEPIVDEVIAEHPDKVQRYRDGKKGLIGFFIGQAMQRSKGKANPQLVRKALMEKLGNSN
jgi:aspartyl-tRNA(Asn)/glutamyl-tRNA(Gln) amidotransferase subunit B